MSTNIDSQTGTIFNMGSVSGLTIHGPAVINVTAQIPLEDLLAGKIPSIRLEGQEDTISSKSDTPTTSEDDPTPPPLGNEERVQLKAMALVDKLYSSSGNMFVAERITNESGELKPGMFLRPNDEPPYQKAEHPDGTVLHGLVFKLTFPQWPMGYDKDAYMRGENLNNDIYQMFLQSLTEQFKIHTFYCQDRTITGAINEEDMRWDRRWDHPETVRRMLIRYADALFVNIAEHYKAIKFRLYCSFVVDNYTIPGGKVCGAAIDTVTKIHEGMGRLFTPLDLDYEYNYEYETEEFKASRKRHYYTSYANKDYLDEGIIIGTTDIDFIGGYGNWYRPVIYNHYKDSKAVILYLQKEMPGKPVKLRIKLKGFVHRIKKSLLDKYYAFKYRNLFKDD